VPEKIPVAKKSKKIEFEIEKQQDAEISNGKYMIRMYKKHPSATFADAMNIVKDYTNWTDDHFLYVVFNEANDDFENLLSLAKAWKVFKFFIDDEEIKKDDINQINDVLFCEHQDYCEGICFLSTRILHKGYRSWVTLYDLVKKLQNTKDKDNWEFQSYFRDMPWTQKKEMKTKIKYIIDKEKLIEILDTSYSIVKKYCELYNFNKIKEEIQKIDNEYTHSGFGIIHSKSYHFEEIEEDESINIKETIKDTSNNYVMLTDEQINLLAKRIGIEMEKVLKKVLKEHK